MVDNFFYVYALKDPRTSPAKPFYIGKGTGSRAYDHLITPDKTRKYRRIKEIIDAGRKPMVEVLVDNLTETQALRIEAELIAAFGTVPRRVWGGFATRRSAQRAFRGLSPDDEQPHGTHGGDCGLAGAQNQV